MQQEPVQEKEPMAEVILDASRITLLGTAHVSKASADKVRELLERGDYDAVAVELCPGRYNALMDPDALARMDLFKVVKEGRVLMVAANLALGAFQQRLAEQFGIEPGAEQREAIRVARERHYPVLLIDREIGITLKRVAHNVPWWQRIGLFSGLIWSLISREEISEQEIERLKEGDMLETTFAEFAEDRRNLYIPLIDERDRYMAARLREELKATEHENVLVVIGAGHLKGIQQHLNEDRTEPRVVINELDQIPTSRGFVKIIPWAITALVLFGFALGFSRNPQLGWDLVAYWVLINGSLSAIGALIATGHPLTILTAFIAAPITSLNPTIGAGMVTAAAEIWLRKPQVGDFSRLRSDCASFKGWWSNRVSRTLLVFILSTLGSAIGTYVAGYLIFDRLTSG